MTAREAINALLRVRYRRCMVMPRFTPIGWWECDLFELTHSGYFREYEVKLTIADFWADAGKLRTRYLPEPRTEKKHDLLAAGAIQGPAQFWFVTPQGLLANEPMPAWAGWIELVPGHRNRLIPVQRKAAPRLHKTKSDQRNQQAVLSGSYHRFLNMLLKAKNTNP